MAIADGVYKIETAMDGLYCDISGMSNANGANLQLANSNSGNNQKFKVSTVGGHRQLTACHSGKVIEVSGTLTAVAHANISQYVSNGGINQKWTLTDANDSTGKPGTVIRSAMNSGYVMDAAYASRASGTNVMLDRYNGGDNQIWNLRKDCIYSESLPVPSNIGLAYEVGGQQASIRAIRGTRTLYPAWVGQNGGYQLRYRTRGRYTGSDFWFPWEAWKSPSGSEKENGWNNVWAQTGSASGSTGVKYGPGIDFTVDQDPLYFDEIQVQVEIRRFVSGSNGPTVGGSATGTITIAYRPTVTFGNIGFAPDGLRVPFQSDFKRVPNKLDITLKVGGKTLVKNYKVTEKGYDDTVVIPFSKLAFIPEDNAECKLTCLFSTIDWNNFSYTATKTIKYNAGHNSSMNVTWSESAGYTETVSLGAHELSEAYILIDQGDGARFIKCEETATKGKYVVAYPFGVEYTVFCVTQDSADVWATRTIKRKAKSGGDFYIWNYNETFTTLKYNVSISGSDDRDYESEITSGRDHEIYAFGEGSASDISISGSIYPEDTNNSQMSDFRRLKGCGFATFRTPLGEYFNVAVLSVSWSNTHKLKRNITVKMGEHS